MSQVRGEWSGIARPDGGYWDRYLNRWWPTVAATFGALVFLDVLLIVVNAGVLPNMLFLESPVLACGLNLVVALPHRRRT